MTNDTRRDSGEIVAANNQALTHGSDALVRRGLRDLTSSDVARFVELGKALTSSLQLDQVLRTIMEKIDESLHPETWSMLLVDEAKQELYFELAIGKNAHTLKDVRIKMGQGIAGWVAVNGETVIVADVQKDSRFLQEVDGWPEIETQSIVAVPVRFRGRCLGVIGLVNCVGPLGFSQTDLSLLQAIADFSAITLENARLTLSIHEMTIMDAHTGLYNGRHLNFVLDSEILRSERYGYEFALLSIAFDGLTECAESLSYVHFTRLLSELGDVVRKNCRLIDSAFYCGDGEIILLLPQTSKETAIVIEHRCQGLFKETLWLRAEGQDLRLSPRIVAVAFPKDGKTKADLLHSMNEAMYPLKK